MLRAAEDHLKLCAARPSPGVRCRGYALMVSAMSDRPEPIPLSLQRRLLAVATADADDTDPKLATSALELLCWITAGETAPQNIRRDAETRAGDGEECRSDWLACVRDADPAEQDRLCAAVLGALQRPERERRLTGLFLLAEQRSPWVFEAQVGRALSLVSDCVQSANADTTAVTTAIKSEHIQLIYAMGALSRLVEQFPEACARLEESVLSAVLDRGLLSRVERVRSAALQLLGGLCSARDSAVVSSFVKTNTLRVMNWIK